MAVVHKVTFFAMYETTFPAVRIEFTKAVTSFRVNIKSTKPNNSTSKTDQEVYRVSQDHHKVAAHLTAW